MRQAYLLMGFLVILIGGGFAWISKEVLVPNREAQALLVKGKMWLEQQNQTSLRKAVDAFSEIVARYPQSSASSEAVMRLAEGYERLGLKEIALGKYRKLLEQGLDSKNTETVRFKIAKLQILRSYTDEGMSQLFLLLGQAKSAHMRSEIYAEIAKVYQKKSDTKNAIKNYRIALREDPENREAQLQLAKLLSNEGQADVALSVYDDYLKFQSEISNDTSNVQQAFKNEALKRGLTLLEQNKYAEAEKYFSVIEDKFPNSKQAEDALYYAGNARMKQGDYIGAIKKFNLVIGNKVRTRDEAAYIKKGEAWYNRSKYKKAAAIFAFVQKTYPRGRFFAIASDWEEECIRALNEAQNLSESSVDEEGETEPSTEKKSPSNKNKAADDLEKKLLEEADRAISGEKKSNPNSIIAP